MFRRCCAAPAKGRLAPCWWTRCRHVHRAMRDRHRGEHDMKWDKPSACDMRFGFEITMYIANR